MNFLRRTGAALVLGYILFFWSELLFWSFWRPESTVMAYAGGWLVYSFFAYIVLWVVDAYRVRSVAAYFLVGALFGWLAEGLYAMTLFGVDGFPFPITVSWTGLAWHAMLSVWIGWLLTRHVLTASVRSTFCLSVAIGLFWGFWAVGWALEIPPLIATPLAFFGFAFVTTALLAAAHMLLPRFAAHSFEPSLAEKIASLLIILAFFFFVTIPVVPMSAVLLPVLMLILWVPLRRNRQHEQPLQPHAYRVPLSRTLLVVCVVPVIATLSYLFFAPFNAIFPTNLLVLIVTTILGFIFFVVSWIRVFGKA